ncbi:MAG: ABC-F family ATP-binding cassette domain-containing protein, partial [Chitinophagales bacterium]|nr:ABC-F family ATP-binding cassette domain-containing protein [Chitinophagales bacterium]
IMMVSHDKTFLDNVTNRTIEIVQGRIEDYPVSYSPYITLRKERKEQLANAAKNQQREIARMERNIERFRAKANKASFAQSLIKKLEKMERIETEEDDGFFLNLRFPPAPPSGKIVLTAEQISKSFDQKKVIQNQSLILQRGEKVAFVGKNGTGKTTFSRILVNNLVPDSGKVTHGHNVIIGYYAQHATESLNPDETVLDTVDKVATGEIRTKLRDLLGAFLFRGDEVYKKVKVLSGGEKSRLALCKMILEPANLLVLDEPTNHLDMPSKEILKQALKNFDGSVLIVSHDRDFLDGLAEKIFEFSKEGIKEHLGDINYFLQKKAAENMRAWEAQRDSKNKPSLQPEKNLKGKSPENGNSKQLKQKLSQIEKQIDALEKKIKDAEGKLTQPDLYESLNNNDFFEHYEQLKRELHDLMHQWELIYAAIESSA